MAAATSTARGTVGARFAKLVERRNKERKQALIWLAGLGVVLGIVLAVWMLM